MAKINGTLIKPTDIRQPLPLEIISVTRTSEHVTIYARATEGDIYILLNTKDHHQLLDALQLLRDYPAIKTTNLGSRQTSLLTDS